MSGYRYSSGIDCEICEKFASYREAQRLHDGATAFYFCNDCALALMSAGREHPGSQLSHAIIVAHRLPHLFGLDHEQILPIPHTIADVRRRQLEVLYLRPIRSTTRVLAFAVAENDPTRLPLILAKISPSQHIALDAFLHAETTK